MVKLPVMGWAEGYKVVKVIDFSDKCGSGKFSDRGYMANRSVVIVPADFADLWSSRFVIDIHSVLTNYGSGSLPIFAPGEE